MSWNQGLRAWQWKRALPDSNRVVDCLEEAVAVWTAVGVAIWLPNPSPPGAAGTKRKNGRIFFFLLILPWIYFVDPAMDYLVPIRSYHESFGTDPTMDRSVPLQRGWKWEGDVSEAEKSFYRSHDKNICHGIKTYVHGSEKERCLPDSKLFSFGVQMSGNKNIFCHVVHGGWVHWNIYVRKIPGQKWPMIVWGGIVFYLSSQDLHRSGIRKGIFSTTFGHR